ARSRYRRPGDRGWGVLARGAEGHEFGRKTFRLEGPGCGIGTHSQWSEAPLVADIAQDARVVERRLAHAAFDPRGHQDCRHAHTKTGKAVFASVVIRGDGCGGRNMIEKAAVLVVGHDQQSGLPQGVIAADGVVDVRYQAVAGSNVGWRVLIVLALAAIARFNEHVGWKVFLRSVGVPGEIAHPGIVG